MTTNASAAAIEIAGRNWLTAQLLVRGFEVAIPTIDRGVDVIVFKETGNHGIRALPLQLKCSATKALISTGSTRAEAFHLHIFGIRFPLLPCCS